MADQSLSEIRSYPIRNNLDAFRASFASLCGDRNISCTPGALDQLVKEDKRDGCPAEKVLSNVYTDIQILALDLLFAIQNHPAVCNLQLTATHSTLCRSLLNLISAVSSNNFDLDCIKCLLKTAIDVHSNDALIWDQVYAAITAALAPAAPKTPSRSIPTPVSGMPVVRSTSSFQGKEQTKKILNRALLYELNGTIFRGVKSFFEKYFEGQSWTEQCRTIYQFISARHVDGRIKMELWVFNRLGFYSSSEFDIHEKLEKFILSLAGYAFMSNQELGFDIFTECRGAKHTIIITSDVSTNEPNEQSTSPGSLTRVMQLALQESCEPRKRASVDSQDTAIAKKQRANSHSSGLRYELKPDAPGSLYDRSPDLYNNRQFGCLAISPAERDLNSFTTIPELLTALRDTIKAHQSLYLTSKILHRDISENNIIITDSYHANRFTRMLINLDLAKQSKRGFMHADGFDELLAQFPPSLTCIKPLCNRLRRILFPVSAEGKLYVGTPPEPKPLYDAVIKEFDIAISNIASLGG
ncbi:hypothetical protein M406DRAFT_71496 [Cryphonectria parasitica EP155]|uniref:non-specific serine/threonine protein kinase n=1 Tax=Cryphonectria parasitica (strain ATCC 38755 / EP155) TaxID=660469 RepID=A0A9P4Y9G4_CRYP1|nr:uncharacterized protein M406DRAFT_71496 [Cryphonectria parasitica EP155]KAF3768495.1 hypothetical protein M406DRAFT_71496 [Cryphonectria parasitica EP155]